MVNKSALLAAITVFHGLTISGSNAAAIKTGPLDGGVTPEEIASFKACMQTVEPAADNRGNNWAQGRSGSMVKALGLMYEVSKDRAILDRMIYFCDALLSERNDLAAAPVGQHQDWTGHIPPAWPNAAPAAGDPIVSAAGEQGDSIGHLAYSAALILASPSLWGAPVTGGDPHHYGATYLARAKTYVTQGDDALDRFVFPRLLNLAADNHYIWAAQRPSGRPGHAGEGAVPWNQQMMFNYAFQGLAQSHEILKDRPDLVKKYDLIVGASIKSFFSSVTRYAAPRTGNPCYNWAYALPAVRGEDANHAAMDVAGMVHAFASGRYGIKESDLTPFANTVLDVMTIGPGLYSGRVDGTSGGNKHGQASGKLRDGMILLAAFKPAAYSAILQPVVRSGGTGDPLAFAYYIWVKNRVHPGE